jgi:hypothetical protein
MEIYGVSPWVIGFIMILISLITPLGIVPINGSFMILTDWFQGPFIYGLLWSYTWRSSSSIMFLSFQFLNLSYIWILVPLSIFSILYVRQIMRYYFGKSSRDSALMAGILSILFPSLLDLVITASIAGISQVGFIIPIPIQFIAGLVLLRKFEGPEVISPWPGQFIDWSWWIRLKAKWSNRAADIIEMHLEEEQEEFEWLESE